MAIETHVRRAQRSPNPIDFRAAHDLGQSRPGRAACPIWEGVWRKESGLSYFKIRAARRGLPEATQSEERHMIARRERAIEEEPMQLRLFLGDNVAFFFEFPDQRVNYRLASLNAASRKMPAGGISLAYKKDAPALIEDSGLDAQRHGPCDQEKEMT
jgi:hypothetical protein